jgi:hypothetical protein
MVTLVAILLGIFMVATVGILITGIIAMSINGPFYQKHSNLLMRLRVVFQGVSIVLFLFLIYVSR